MTTKFPSLSSLDIGWLNDTYMHLHRTPELSMQEHATAAFIEQQLTELGIENFRCGGTGVVGIMGNGDGPTVAFRADIDGLPIKEDTGAEYASRKTGHLPDGTEVPVMHGCGHDTHVAVLLAAARVLWENKQNWAGTLVLLFQPGEETGAGAKAMVADGLWERAPRPEVVLGQHVFPHAVGTVHISSGTAMALADSLKVTLHGRQSHGSQPQDSVDPIVLGAHIITRLQGIVSRELAPTTPAVVTVGTFNAGLKENIIPDRAEFTLNIRTLTPEVRVTVLDAVARIVNAEAQASHAPQPDIEFLYDFPRCYNDPDHTSAVIAVLRAELGDEQVVLVPPVMGSEDVGWLGDSIGVPTVYWFFGGFPATEKNPPVNHSPYFLPAMEPTLASGVCSALTAITHYLA